MQYVLAADRQRYMQYIERNRLVDRRDAIYIRDGNMLRAIKMDESELVRLSGYQLHPDFANILEILPTCFRRPHDVKMIPVYVVEFNHEEYTRIAVEIMGLRGKAVQEWVLQRHDELQGYLSALRFGEFVIVESKALVKVGEEYVQHVIKLAMLEIEPRIIEEA